MTRAAKTAEVDLLYGLEAIGQFLGINKRQTKHRVASGAVPTFKMGRGICARRSVLESHFARAAAAGDVNKAASPAAVVPAAPPTLLYGHRAIAAHLGLPAADVTRLDAERRLPTYQDDGCTVASTAALDHWASLKGGAA